MPVEFKTEVPPPTAEELEEMIQMLTGLGIDGMLLTPGYHYQVLTNDDLYLKKEDMPLKFQRVRKLADDHKIVRDGLKRILASTDLEVAAEAADGDELLKLVKAHDYDVAVIDMSMPGLAGLALLGALVCIGLRQTAAFSPGQRPVSVAPTSQGA